MKRGEIYSLPAVDSLPLRAAVCGLNDCDPIYYNKRECSNITVLGHILKGHGTIKVESASHSLSAGDTFILPKYTYHEVSADPDASDDNRWVYIWINLEDDFVLELLRACGLEYVYRVHHEEILTFFEQFLSKAAVFNFQDSPTAAASNFASLIFQIIHTLGLANQREKQHVSPFASSLQEYILKHLETRITINELAQHFSMSARSFNNLCKRELGVTPYQLVLEEKLKLACRLLEQTNLPIQQVADRLCFADMYYFSNLFKQKTGVSPTQYRKAAH
ncbi:AraC family transcriptional regulator [Paenibacillus sp. PL2-23]|uniref:AraC family transcriptional regulator n=1 Tax=Paenibacillus sp. PL2-23 TaxID=2100729 RepID=UPI0030F8A13D